MGKITGFLEATRQLPTKRSVAERLNDYKEFVDKYEPEILNQQSGRCMNCGVPFCNNGCPLGNIIPEFNDAVYQNDWLLAYEILNSTNNFPEFTGRICPAPCESACVLGINQPAVVIEEIEKHIIEHAFENGFVKANKFIKRTNKKVAVIGSGPAGLAAAAQLNMAGHNITVFERDDLPGGLLRYGIPDFKLEKWVVDRRINIMEQEGIVFKCNVNVGIDYNTNALLRDFDAIVLACGSTIPRDLIIPGRDGDGVHFAMDFLKQQNKKNSETTISDKEILATNKHVVVIGGGDTGSDCVGTSNRQKAKSVTQFELMPMPPTVRNEQMPWPSFPMLLKTTSSHEEGAVRQWAIATKAFITNNEGHLTAIKVVDLEWSTKNGKPASFVEIEGSEKIIPCDLVLLAMGFVHPQIEGLISQISVAVDSQNNVKADDKTYATNINKVFAAGDVRRGQSLVVWAISEGRECAKKVDEYLMGKSFLPSKHTPQLSLQRV